jgi:hypothetical protein
MGRVFLIVIISLAANGCGGAGERSTRRALSDDDIAAFGAERNGQEAPREETRAEARPTAIELANGERLEELRALIRFDAGEGAAPACAVYALRVGVDRVEEGRVNVSSCDAASVEADVVLSPVEETRLPRLVAALSGAELAQPSASVTATSPRAVHLVLTTDRREVEGDAAAIRWPTPDGEASEPSAERSPRDLSELWEAVIYPHRYRR